METLDNGAIANIITVLMVIFGIGHYKGKVDNVLGQTAELDKKLDAYHKRLDTHGDDLVKLNTKAELSMTSKDVDEKYVSKELFRQFEKHIDSRFDSIDKSLGKLIKFVGVKDE